MSDTPPINPHEDEEPVVIERGDIEVIISGLRAMPEAMTRMADSITVLADNTNKAPTKSYTALLNLASSVAVCLVLLLVVTRVENLVNEVIDSQDAVIQNQQAGRARSEEIAKTLDTISDCLDVADPDRNGSPKGDCATTLVDFAGMVINQFRTDLRCETQVSLREFVAANPSFNIEPPPIDPECTPYSEDRDN